MRVHNLLVFVAAVQGAIIGRSANMNGDYIVASVDKVGVPFEDDYAARGHDYFDVWAPEIATTYGQAFWTDQHNQPLPKEIVERFKGKVIAITGYEHDQVMVDPVGQPGVNPDRDVSVPINWAYNHHYMMWMTGEHSELKQVPADPNDHMAHGAPTKWVPVNRPSAALRSDPDIPTSQFFSEGNGGESRKSFHGYPRGFAQLVESPQTWHITPMQIDTRRRDCGATRDDVHRCTQFEPWIEPKQARYGRPWEGANSSYSGILECPCNERFAGDPIFYPHAQTKMPLNLYVGLPSGSCAANTSLTNIQSAAACYEAANALGVNHTRFVNTTIDEPIAPAGCSLKPFDNGTVAVVFNIAPGAKGECAAGEGAGAVRRGETTSSVNITFGLVLDPRPSGGLATITLRGPSDAWFGVGINAQNMADSPYTIYVNATGAFEQKIGTCGSEAEHCPGDPLAPSITLVSNTEVDGVREVVVTRPFKGLTAKHYTFSMGTSSPLKFITAFGTSQVFDYHGPGHHHGAQLVLLAPTGMSTCLCADGASASMCETGGVNCGAWTRSCIATWDGVSTHEGADLGAQQNPTCNSATYAGGLRCCSHLRIMLDSDQDPGPDLLRYHVKMRFWFQEYVKYNESEDTFVHRPGVLGGDDVREPQVLSTPEALAVCKATAGCRGITFASGTALASAPVTTYFRGQRVPDPADGVVDLWQSWVVDAQESHHDLPRYYYTTEAYAGEYDVPPAFRRVGDPPIPGYPNVPVSRAGELHLTPGTTCTGNCPEGDDCDCVHTITYNFVMSNARMLYIGGHCHAPSCISLALYRNDTGTPQLICLQRTAYGQGNVTSNKFDENGYLTLPPCLNGDADEGLEPPSWLPANTPMYSIKKNRNTWSGHYGEMASWQMRGVAFPAEKVLRKVA